jgi:hypothetical protein
VVSDPDQADLARPVAGSWPIGVPEAGAVCEVVRTHHGGLRSWRRQTRRSSRFDESNFIRAIATKVRCSVGTTSGAQAPGRAAVLAVACRSRPPRCGRGIGADRRSRCEIVDGRRKTSIVAKSSIARTLSMQCPQPGGVRLALPAAGDAPGRLGFTTEAVEQLRPHRQRLRVSTWRWQRSPSPSVTAGAADV